MSVSGNDLQPLVRVSDAARGLVREVRAGESDADRLALWLEVSGVSGPNYTYDLYFQALSDASPEDSVIHDDEVPLVILASSVDKVRGATLDVGADGGMVMINPNAPPAAPGIPPTGDLSGEVAQRVLAVLEQQVNPGIALHGGRADLVSVDEGTAFLALSGGCQGCGMARVTLSQGIEVAITEAVPEITSVVDVTDHAAGTDPYFEGAKK